MEDEVDRLIDRVENQLVTGNFNYQKEMVLGDTRPDFLVTTSAGDHVLLEVKDWNSSPENTARAIHQANIYKKLSKASAALIVTAEGEFLDLEAGGVVAEKDLAETLVTLTQTLLKQKKSGKSSYPKPAPKKKVFASMPLSASYDDTFLVGIEPASLANSAAADRVDHSGTAGNVISQIQNYIRNADALVADLSDSRPNVLHEIGYAEALGKKVVQICSTSTKNLPFNVRNNQTIKYSIGQTTSLRKKLEKELKKII